MIVSQTPYRVSLAAKDTDLPAFSRLEFRDVLSMTIDKYIYVVIHRQFGAIDPYQRLPPY